MDRRDRTRRATSAAASMAALAAAAAAGEGAENGTATAMAEDMNTPTLLTEAASGVSLTPTAAVPVSARNGPAAVAGAVEAGAGGGGGGPSCQADRCGANLADAKRYHKRHKVCETHAKAHVVIVAGRQQRFCQQCSRGQTQNDL